jgi:hypothetical protein
MKTQIYLGSSPGVRANSEQNNTNDPLKNEESVQVNPQNSVEKEDLDNWYNESSI